MCFAPKVLSHDWLAGSSITYPNDDSDKDLQINLCYNMPNLHIWPNLKITNFKENPKLLGLMSEPPNVILIWDHSQTIQERFGIIWFLGFSKRFTKSLMHTMLRKNL